MAKIAFIGAGSMAREHIRAFKARPDAELAGIYSRTKPRAEALAQEFGIPLVCDSVADLARRTEATLVVVAVPELALNAVAKAAFAESWSVLLEKPAGYSFADAQDIESAARGRASPVMVGFNRRFYASTMKLKASLDAYDGTRFVHIQDQQSFAEARRYNHPEPVVENFMYANSIHVIDLARHLCRGSIVGVNRIMPWRGEATEVVLTHLAFESGDAALYEGLWRGPGPWSCSVSTAQRRWTMQPLERLSFQNANERAQNTVEPDPIDASFKAGFARQAEAVLARANGRPSAAVSIAESLQTMELIREIFGV